MNPLVSICIPTYNGAAYIAEAMDSLIVQSYYNLEIIVSDDNSNDNTLEVIESYRNKTSIPIYIYSNEPKGIGVNWNNCVIKSNGAYIKFLFQDDKLDRDCIEKMINLAMSDNQIGLVYCRRRIIAKEATKEFKNFKSYYGNLHKYWKDFTPTTGVLSGLIYLKDPNILNSPKNKIGEPTALLIKKECFQKTGFFSEKLSQTLDVEFCYRLMPYFKIGFLDERLAYFRLHKDQASTVNKLKRHSEDEAFLKSCYVNLRPYLYRSNRWKLNKRFHPLVKFLVKLKQIVVGKKAFS